AYLSWPVAVLHGIGTGSDTKLWWMLLLTAGCVAAVLAAVLVRVARSDAKGSFRAPAYALSIAAPIGIAIFTIAGPLAPHWARRAGTPTRLLGASLQPAAVRVPAGTRTTVNPGVSLQPPFSARLEGTVTQTQESGGAIVDLALRLSGG